MAQQTTLPVTQAPAEIIVTARRRGEPLAQAGVPVSAADGQDLLKSGVRTADQLPDRFPALTVQPTSTGNLIFVRGVGNFTLLPNSDPAVGYAYDGVFLARPMGTLTQFFDLERVELLKGPQGVLYGRNASAGSINLEPRHPLLGDTSGYVHLSAASDAQRQGEAALNLALGHQSALRFSVALSRQHHALEGYSAGPAQQSIRAQIKTRIGEGISARLVADLNHLGGVGIGTSYVGNYVLVPSQARYSFTEAPLSQSEGIYSGASQAYRQTIFLAGAGRNLDAIDSRPRQDSFLGGVHAHIDADLGSSKLTLIPAWQRSSIDAVVSGSPFGYRQRDDYEQMSLEARLSGRSGAAEWLAGTLLFQEDVQARTGTNLSSSLILSDQRFGSRSLGLFANMTVHATSFARLSGGIRWTRDRKTFDSRSDSLTILCQRIVNDRPSCPEVPLFPLVDSRGDIPFALPEAPGESIPILVGGVPAGASVAWSGRTDEGRLIDRALTWRLGAEADLTPRTLFYASVEKGYRPGGFNAATGFETFDPERITAYTLGLRHRTFGQRLQIDLEAFWWIYRDQQVSSLRPDLSSQPRNANITDNIGNSRIRGIEAEVSYRPWTGGTIDGTIQRLDAEYQSFQYLQANLRVPPLTGCAATLEPVTNLYTVDCTSKQPYNSPRWSFRLEGHQRVPVGKWTMTLVADTYFRASRNIGFAFLPEQRIGPTWRSNLQLILLPPNGQFEIGAFVRNIEGERVPEFMIFHPVSNALVASTSLPRQWGIRSRLRL